MADTPETIEEPELDPATGKEPKRGLSRRQFIPGVAGVLAVLGLGGVGGYELREREHTGALAATGGSTSNTPEPLKNPDIPPAGTPGSGVQTYVSRPDLRVTQVRVNDLSLPGDASDERFVVLAPMADANFPGRQRGPMIMDRRGRVVWYSPRELATFDVQVQSYQGKPVLTFWYGGLVGGHGVGAGQILDDTYKTIATVGNAKTRPIDLHELNITPQGTALATYFEQKATDLSSVGGPTNGYALVGHALEIDIATGKTLLDWVSLDHVPLSDSYVPASAIGNDVYDFFHINSISLTTDGQLLISGRNTSTIYKVDRKTGDVIWRLGGKQSDFKVAQRATFGWQHHVRQLDSGTISLFDNANGNPNGSMAKIISFDESGKTVTLDHAYQHPAKFLASALGSVQKMANGNVYVGWGAQPYLSEFSEDGTLLVDGQFESQSRSYRAFLADWVGHPTTKPDVVAKVGAEGGFAIYVSWNGATEVDHWVVMAGSSTADMVQIASQAWSDFETAIFVHSQGPAFQVVAIDKDGNELGRSEVV
jgi:hypothetical protein